MNGYLISGRDGWTSGRVGRLVDGKRMMKPSTLTIKLCFTNVV